MNKTFNKTEKLVLVGKSASGKDYILKKLIDLGLNYIPKITTRPKRQNETDGLEYFFIDNISFENLIIDDKILVYQKFFINNSIWYYGISKENFYNSKLFIMTPNEIKNLNEQQRNECFIVHLDIDEEVRIKRLNNRLDSNDSIIRRINSDKIDFDNYNDYDMKICDPNFEIEDILKFML